MSNFEITNIIKLRHNFDWLVINVQLRKKVLFAQPKKIKPAPNQAKQASISADCRHSYGYLADRPKNTPIPNECLFCLRVTGCLSNILQN